jgi:thiamine transport system ATP-binding protein
MITFEKGVYHHGAFCLSASFSLAAKSFCAILGPSGAGKSTLLNIIAGFEDLTTGSLTIDGIDMRNFPPAVRPISMVFQDHNVFAHLSVWENVALGIATSLKLSAGQSAAVDTALARVGLQHYAARLPGQISGGERQRVAMARVLVRQSKILLLDEPFAALDPGLRSDMLLLVKDLAAEHQLTVLLVTHQPEEAKQAADSIIFVGGGVAHAPQTVDTFFASQDEPIRKYLGHWN